MNNQKNHASTELAALNSQRLAVYGTALFMAMASMAADAQQPVQTAKPFELCVAEQVTYDSNLYRLPDGVNATSILGSSASRDDYLYKTSLCANGNWQLGRQKVVVKGDVSDNRYVNNDILNNTSANGDVTWNWQTAGDWSGKIGGHISHGLGTFFNDRPVVKDTVNAYQYSAEIRHPVIGRWNAVLGGQRTSTTHSSDERDVDNFESNAGQASLEYVSRANNLIAVDYQYSRASYPAPLVLDGVLVQRDFNQEVAGLRFNYSPGDVTRLQLKAGYLQRQYPRDTSRDYSGTVGRLSLNYQPLDKLQLTAEAWRELTSYFDVEANYFVSRGVSFTPSWTPRERLTLAVLAWWERQDYLANGVATDQVTGALIANTLAGRKDEVMTLGGQVGYRFLKYFDLSVSYRNEQRDSNRPLTGYHDNVASAMLRARF